MTCARKVDVRLPGKENSNSHGARPVHLIIPTIKWIRTSRLPIKNSLSLTWRGEAALPPGLVTREANYLTEMCSGSEAGSYFRLIDFMYHSTLGLRVIKSAESV